MEANSLHDKNQIKWPRQNIEYLRRVAPIPTMANNASWKLQNPDNILKKSNQTNYIIFHISKATIGHSHKPVKSYATPQSSPVGLRYKAFI